MYDFVNGKRYQLGKDYGFIFLGAIEFIGY